MPDRFKIRKKFYDNNIEFQLDDTAAPGRMNPNNASVKTEYMNKDYRGVAITRGNKEDTIA